MTILRQKLIDEIEVRGLSRNTTENYVGAVFRLARHYHRAPDQISDDELKQYLLHLLRKRQLAASTLIVVVSALRFFYQHVLQRSTQAIAEALPRMKKPRQLPRVYSQQELARLFQVKRNPKHRAMLLTAYGAGLRVSELCHLRVEDLLGDRGQIRVAQGKGRKDRYTVLSPKLRSELQAYYRRCRPTYWLFPSPVKPDFPVTDTTAQNIFRQAVQAAGLPQHDGIHSLRHSFATHLMEAEVPLPVIQRLLGHRSLASTSRYLYVRREVLTQLQGPLEGIDLTALQQPTV